MWSGITPWSTATMQLIKQALKFVFVDIIDGTRISNSIRVGLIRNCCIESFNAHFRLNTDRFRLMLFFTLRFT